MTESEFNRLAAEGYNRIPVTLETFADLDTPLSIYLKLANDPYSYLLESVQGGERFGRYSFIGLAANTRIAVDDGAIMLLTGNRVAERRDHTNPMAYISEFMSRFKVPDLPGLPRFCGGLVGSFGYDTVRYIETKLATTAKPAKPDPLGVPDILLLLSEEIAIVDNLSGKLTLVVYAEPGFPGAWKQAQARLKELLAKLRAPVRSAGRRPHRLGARRVGIRRGSLQGRRAARQAVHRRWRHHAGGAFAAHEQALRGEPAGALPRAAHAEPLALHVLFRLRGFPRRRRLAGNPGAARRRQDGEDQASPCAPSPARASAARPWRKTKRSPPICWPTPRSAPST